MSEELTKVPSDLRTVKFRSPLVQGICELIVNASIQAVPVFGSSVATLLFGGVALYRERRLFAFLDELDKRIGAVSEEALRDEDFIHAFKEATRGAMNEKHEEKVRMFARLLANYSTADMHAAADEFDWCLAILEDISLREYTVLVLLDRFEKQLLPGESGPRTPAGTARIWLPFMLEVEKTLGIPLEDVTPIVIRLVRTGLIRTDVWMGDPDVEYCGTKVDYSTGHLTRLFDQFSKWVCSEAATPDSAEAYGPAYRIVSDDLVIEDSRKSVRDKVFFCMDPNLPEERARALANRLSDEGGFSVLVQGKRGPGSGENQTWVHDFYRYEAIYGVNETAAKVRAFLGKCEGVVLVSQTVQGVRML